MRPGSRGVVAFIAPLCGGCFEPGSDTSSCGRTNCIGAGSTTVDEGWGALALNRTVRRNWRWAQDSECFRWLLGGSMAG